MKPHRIKSKWVGEKCTMLTLIKIAGIAILISDRADFQSKKDLSGMKKGITQ